MSGRKVLVVGGGKTGERKILKLVECGALVKVVSPKVTDAIKRLSEKEEIVWEEREFREEDIGDFFLVFAATNKRDINNKIAKICRKRGIPVNVVDSFDDSDFIIPSSARYGDLMVAVSTGGISPGIARFVRKNMEKTLSELSNYLELLKDLRDKIKNSVEDEEKRREILLFLGSEDGFDIYRTSGRDGILNFLREKGVNP